jgi:hypothetical protein
MDREVTLAAIFPLVLLVDRYADEVRHQVRESEVVIAFHPYHFHVALGIGQLANVGEELPMLFLQPSKVQVVDDVAQQDETAERRRLQNIQSVTGATNLRAQVNVRQDERVISSLHAFILVLLKGEIDEFPENSGSGINTATIGLSRVLLFSITCAASE